MNILYLLGGLAIGFVSIWYSRQLGNTFGRMDWAERAFGATGTLTAWKLIGVGAIVLGYVFFRYGAPA